MRKTTVLPHFSVISLFLLFLILLVSYTPPAHAANWSSWTTHACYKGLSFRAKWSSKSGGSDRWLLQYKNSYRETIHFSQNIVNPSRTDEGFGGRIHVKAGDTYTTWDYVKNAPAGGGGVLIRISRDDFYIGKDLTGNPSSCSSSGSSGGGTSSGGGSSSGSSKPKPTPASTPRPRDPIKRPDPQPALRFLTSSGQNLSTLSAYFVPKGPDDPMINGPKINTSNKIQLAAREGSVPASSRFNSTVEFHQFNARESVRYKWGTSEIFTSSGYDLPGILNSYPGKRCSYFTFSFPDNSSTLDTHSSDSFSIKQTNEPYPESGAYVCSLRITMLDSDGKELNSVYLNLEIWIPETKKFVITVNGPNDVVVTRVDNTEPSTSPSSPSGGSSPSNSTGATPDVSSPRNEPLSPPFLRSIKLTNRPDNIGVTISWDSVDGANSYEVYRCQSFREKSCDELVRTTSSTGILHEDSSYTGYYYYYSIRSCTSSSGCGDFSRPVRGEKLDIKPAAPTGVSAALSPPGNSVTIKWSHAWGSAGSQIYRCESANTASCQILATKNNDTSAITEYLDDDVSLLQGNVYYRVRAQTSGRLGDYSDAAVVSFPSREEEPYKATDSDSISGLSLANLIVGAYDSFGVRILVIPIIHSGFIRSPDLPNALGPILSLHVIGFSHFTHSLAH